MSQEPWYKTPQEMQVKIDEYFNTGGTSNGTFTVDNEILWHFAGKWSLDKNILS